MRETKFNLPLNYALVSFNTKKERDELVERYSNSVLKRFPLINARLKLALNIEPSKLDDLGLKVSLVVPPIDIIGLNYENNSTDYLFFYLLEKLVSYASFGVFSLCLKYVKDYLNEVYRFFYIPKIASYVVTIGLIYCFTLNMIGFYSVISKINKSKSRAYLKALAMARTC